MIFPIQFWLMWQLSMRAMFNPCPAPKERKETKA